VNAEGIGKREKGYFPVFFKWGTTAISARNYINPPILFSEDKNPLPLHKLGIFMHNSEKDAKGKTPISKKNVLFTFQEDYIIFLTPSGS